RCYVTPLRPCRAIGTREHVPVRSDREPLPVTVSDAADRVTGKVRAHARRPVRRVGARVDNAALCTAVAAARGDVEPAYHPATRAKSQLSLSLRSAEAGVGLARPGRAVRASIGK